MRRAGVYLAALLAAVAVGAIAISNQSLWIDEGTTAIKALQPSLTTLWQSLRVDGSSNLQLPLHYLYLWTWEKFFGGSEIALRAANVPPLALAFVAIVWGLEQRPRWAFWFVAIAALDAFTWYYTNEARPYLLLFAGCCVTFACIARARFSPRECGDRWYWTLLAGAFVVCATSAIAAPWALTALVGALYLLGKNEALALVRRNALCSGLWLLFLCCLGGYYVWTMLAGAVPTSIGGTGLTNLIYVLYEQLGFAGLGPGRVELRGGQLAAFVAHSPGLAIAGLSSLAVLWAGARFLARKPRLRPIAAWIGFLILLPAAAIVVAAWLGHARLWGRHFTPLYPFVLFALAVGMSELLRHKTALAKSAGGIFLLALLASSLQIRFAPRHARDDYRRATAEAKRALLAREKIWWAADRATASYYQLSVSKESDAPVRGFQGPFPEDIAALPAPGMIVLSKPDVYDGHGAIFEYARTRGFRVTHVFQAFEIWEKAP